MTYPDVVLAYRYSSGSFEVRLAAAGWRKIEGTDSQGNAYTLFWRSNYHNVAPQGFSIEQLQRWATRQTGMFAAVVVCANEVAIVTNRSRAYSVLFAHAAGKWVIADRPEPLQNEFGLNALNRAAAAEFAHTSFVVGTDTLLQGVSAAPAGSVITLRPKNGKDSGEGTVEIRPYHMHGYGPEEVTDPVQMSQTMKRALEVVLRRTMEYADGRQLLIPLSGGIDSRLLVALLSRAKYPNLRAFTYGKTGSSEVAISRQVADRFGVSWVGIDLDPREVRRSWAGSEAKRFVEYCWDAQALPHIQDWYALSQLRARGLVDEDAVVLPGHTVVGVWHDELSETRLGERVDTPTGELVEIISRHHYMLRGEPLFGARCGYSKAKIERFIEDYRAFASVPSRVNIVEAFDVLNRQSKYINNSMRAYEFFGYGWDLPMCDVEMWQVWNQEGAVFRDNARTWYREFTDALVADEPVEGVFGGRQTQAWAQEQLKYQGAPVDRIPPALRRVLIPLLIKIGLRHKLNRMSSVVTEMRHPMAFEALCGNLSQREIGLRLLGGMRQIGLYCELFLDNQWNQANVVPPLR